MKLLLFAMALLFAANATGQAENIFATANQISLVQLIATPEKFDGATVAVIGYLRLEFEGNGLYLHEEDYKQQIYKNAIWVSLSPTLAKARADFSDHYVLAVGTFDAKHNGHLSQFSGELKVQRCIQWSPASGNAPKPQD
jgi:hypothetical protein